MSENEEMSVEQLALGERKFLHDISNQMVVAQGMGSIALKNIKASEAEVDPKIIERLEKSNKAISKMIELIKARRTTLHTVSI
jgi:hypothetical protein